MAAINWKSARKRPPRAASNKPGREEVCSFRIAVTSRPHPVALSTAAGASDVAGCGLRRAASANSPAIKSTTPIASQSTSLTLADGTPEAVDFVG